MTNKEWVLDGARTGIIGKNDCSRLRAMYMSDLGSVLKIIEAHDEDDAEAAESDYQDNGVENQFVLEIDDQIVGVTGYREVEATEGTFWLSWTYLKQSSQGQGMGKIMVLELLDKLREIRARKIFVKVSDYQDSNGVKIYERALHLYESLGFKTEVVNHGFYDEGENQHILGFLLGDESDHSFDGAGDVVNEKANISFCGLFEIAETEGAYSFSWTVEKKKRLFGKRNFTADDLKIGLETAKNQGGRKIFLTFPSNLPLIHSPLQEAGFKYVGQLADYYEPGVHEYHFEHDLENSVLDKNK